MLLAGIAFVVNAAILADDYREIEQRKVVWSLSLQDGSEGPTLIDYIVTQNESSVADSFCSWRT